MATFFVIVTVLGVLFVSFSFLRSMTFWEDLIRVLCIWCRVGEDPAVHLALFRLEILPWSMRRRGKDFLIQKWRYLQPWIQHEVGYFFLGHEVFLHYFELAGENTVGKDPYFVLFKGVFSHGTLPQFIKAVRLYEAAVYACNSNDFYRAAGEHLSCNFDPSADDELPDWINMNYSNSRRISVLTDLLTKLQAVRVSSLGKHWLRATIHDIREFEVTEISELYSLVDSIPNLGKNRPDFALN